MTWFIASALIFFALSSNGDALECYTCSGHVGIPNSMNDCERFHYYENHKKSVCMPGDQVCAKYVVNHDGMTWVHRSCRPYDICKYLRYMYNNGRDQLMECSTCSDRDLCNSAATYYVSVLLIVSMFIAFKNVFMC